MKFQKRNTPNLRPLDNDSVAPFCPLLNIPRMDEHGMVLETRCGFEVGSTIALGFHLQCCDDSIPHKHASQGQHHDAGSNFISVEAIVVESKIGSSSSGQPVHLVTILFSQITRKDIELLLRYSGSHSNHPLRKPFASTSPSLTPSDFNKKIRREISQRIHLN